MATFIPIVRIAAGALVITVAVFGISLMNRGSRDQAPLESINGVDYPIVEERIQVYEALAHTDIALVEPVFGKVAQVDVTFIPHDVRHLSVGIRRNSFWLSYDLLPLYDSTADDQRAGQAVTKTITVPLTDKLQDHDRSLDLMFFAANSRPVDPASLINQPTYWELLDLTVSVQNETPSPLATLNYLVSIVTRERAL